MPGCTLKAKAWLWCGLSGQTRWDKRDEAHPVECVGQSVDCGRHGFPLCVEAGGSQGCGGRVAETGEGPEHVVQQFGVTQSHSHAST